MFVDLDKYINICTKLKISANQFLLCYLLFVDERNKKGKFRKKGKGMANLYKYSSRAIPWTNEEIDDLEEKGLIDRSNHPPVDKRYPDYYELSDEFKEMLFIEPSRFRELWKLYPTTIPNFKNPKGPKIKLKVTDPDKLQELYYKKVKTKIKHKEILELVQWAIDNNEINTSIENFVKSELWDTYAEMRDEEDFSGNVSIAR